VNSGRARRPRTLVALALALGLAGCRDLQRFDTTEGKAYCGHLVQADFVRRGLLPDAEPPSLNMRLYFDTSQLSSIPGSISTDDAARGLCKPLPLFQDAPLRAIEEVQNDSLSLLEFGEGREHNFLAWVDSSCTQTMLAVISLMKNDSIEIRLLKPAAMPTAGAPRLASDPGFGIFRLGQQTGSCGF